MNHASRLRHWTLKAFQLQKDFKHLQKVLDNRYDWQSGR
jgi:hypothetical protein